MAVSTIRFARIEDLPQQKLIWQLCFGDQQADIDFYYSYYDQPDKTLVFETAGLVQAMLTMLPIRGVLPNGFNLEATMLYAIATHPEHQKKGLAAMLIEKANQISQQQNQPFTILVPASLSLFDYYSKQGYRPGFWLRETRLEATQIKALGSSQDNLIAVNLTAVSAKAYNQIRQKKLAGSFHIAYADQELEYQKKSSQRSGVDIYALDVAGEKGCAIIEKVDSAKMIIKELIIADEYLEAVLQRLACEFSASEYLIRTPVANGAKLGGKVRAFGVMRVNQPIEEFMNIQDADCGYLGIAFD